MGNQQYNSAQLQKGYGYRVIQIQKDSPGFKANLLQFLDYIVDIENQDENEKNFFKIIKENEDKPLDFLVYNMATRSFRTIQIIPSYQWKNSDGLLGISLRYEKWQDSHELTFKVQNVYKDSPAERAKLQSSSDYIVGLLKYKYQNEEEMIKYITECEYENDGFIEVAIYNQISKQVRIVKLHPCSKWGGKGSLGLELGSGMLNQIPQIKDSFEEKQLYNSIYNTENEDTSKKQNEQYQGNCSQKEQKINKNQNLVQNEQEFQTQQIIHNPFKENQNQTINKNAKNSQINLGIDSQISFQHQSSKLDQNIQILQSNDQIQDQYGFNMKEKVIHKNVNEQKQQIDGQILDNFQRNNNIKSKTQNIIDDQNEIGHNIKINRKSSAPPIKNLSQQQIQKNFKMQKYQKQFGKTFLHQQEILNNQIKNQLSQKNSQPEGSQQTQLLSNEQILGQSNFNEIQENPITLKQSCSSNSSLNEYKNLLQFQNGKLIYQFECGKLNNDEFYNINSENLFNLNIRINYKPNPQNL